MHRLHQWRDDHSILLVLIHEFNKNALVIIMSDRDSAYRGDNRDEDQNFQKILSNNN